MKRVLGSLVVGLLACQVWAAGFESKQVSAGATWVAHVDLEQLRQTQLGSYLTNKLSVGPAADKLAAVQAIFSFDPRKDLNTVTLYGKSQDPAQSVALLGGTFNEARLITLVKANDSYQTLVFGKHTLHSWIDDKKPNEGRQYGCFHPSGVLVISRGQAMVQEALDVLDHTHDSLDFVKAFGSEAQMQAPIFVAGANLNALGDFNPNAAFLKQASSGQLALGESNGLLAVNLLLTAKDASVATNLQQVAQGILAIAQLGQQKNPQLADLAQAAQVRQTGNTVHVDISYPVARVMAMIDGAMAVRPPQAAPQPVNTTAQ